MSTVTPRLIASASDWSALLDDLAHEPLLGLDTEAASFHRFRDRVYLLQISSRSITAVVDPLAVPGLPGLGDLLGNASIEWVLHDADYDLRLLQHEYRIGIEQLFDTRIAAQFLNEPGIGLAALLERWLGIRIDKKFQRADWSQRPLTPGMIEYAATDTHYLPELRDRLRDQLTLRGRLSWVEEECRLSRTVQWAPEEPPETAFLHMKGARALDRRGLAILRELFAWRERVAATLDRARFRVLGNEAMLALAKEPPDSVENLARTSGVGRDLAARRGAELMAAIERGRAVPDRDLPRFPRNPRWQPDPEQDQRFERLKAVRTALAAELELAPGVLCPNGVLEGIARAYPRDLTQLAAVPGVRQWQVEVIGSALLTSLTPS